MIESMRYAATLAMREAGEDKAREKQSKSGTGGRVMTLDDAIANAEVVARREEYNYKIYAQVKPRNDVDKANCEHAAKSCLKSVKEHRQLAEWLKELKERREKDDRN
jgi:hypothetical protein